MKIFKLNQVFGEKRENKSIIDYGLLRLFLIEDDFKKNFVNISLSSLFEIIIIIYHILQGAVGVVGGLQIKLQTKS